MIPRWIFNSCVDQLQRDKDCGTYKTYDHFVALTFGQLNKRYTLGAISANIAVSEKIIEDLCLMQSPAKSIMCDSNKKSPFKAFETLYHRAIKTLKLIL